MAAQDTNILQNDEIANILYKSFSQALKDYDVKLSERSKVEEILKKEFATISKFPEKEIAKMTAAIEKALDKGFKKGGSVREEIQKYFKELTTQIYNSPKSRRAVSESYPETEKAFKQREDRLKKSSLGKYNRLSDKYNKVVNDVTNNSEKLGELSKTLSRSSRKLESITNLLINKADKIEGNVSWLESAASNISKSSEKTSKLSNSLITQSIKIDRESGWIESGINSLKSSSKRLSGTFRKTYSIFDKSNKDNDDSDNNQEENSFINKLVKKLENSKLGAGLKSSLFAAAGILTGSYLQQHGHPLLARTALIAGTHPAEVAGTIWGAAKLAKYAKNTPWIGSKLAPGLGALSFGMGAYSDFKRGDKISGSINTAGALGSAAVLLSPLFGPGAPIVAAIGGGISLLALLYDSVKFIDKNVRSMHDIFKPFGDFFGKIAKWWREHFGGPKPPQDPNKANHPIISSIINGPGMRQIREYSWDNKFHRAAPTGEFAAHMINVSGKSQSQVASLAAKNPYYESISSGGIGWTTSSNKGDFATDVRYGRKGTTALLNKALSIVRGDPNLSAAVPRNLVITSALASGIGSPHNLKDTGGHITGMTLDAVTRGGKKLSKKELESAAKALYATGIFSSAVVEEKGGLHMDLQLKESEYEKLDKKSKENIKQISAATTQKVTIPQILPLTNSLKADVAGNETFSRMVMNMNYMGRDYA